MGAGGGPEFVSLGGSSKVRNQSVAYGFDYSWSSSLVTDFRFGFFRYKVNVLPFDFGQNTAADAGIKLRPSVLLIFGNPPLGTQFITANANTGLDWPVRLLVYEKEKAEVWTAYTDFDWIARRHGIKNRNNQFKMASTVIASITSSVEAK